MKIAAISDIHGNIEALNAVIDDINRENIEKIFVLGDLSVGGPDPDAVIDRLQELSADMDITFILGNTDEMILKANENEGSNYYPGDPTMKEAVKYCQRVLQDNHLRFLASLPEKRTLKFGNLDLLLVHGSPRSIGENIYPDLDESKVQEMIQGQEEDIIFCGHTHLPVVYRIGLQTVINTGSVGRPFTDNPDSCYAVLDYPDIGSKSFDVIHKFVKYNNQATAVKLRNIGLEGGDKLAEIIINPMKRLALFK